MTNKEKQKERFTDLIIESVDGCARHWAEIIADYLLKNGAIVPIFQIGEKVFVIDTDDEIRERTVSAIFFRKKVCVVYTCGSGILGTVYEQSHPNGSGLYRTRQEAEQALKERGE